MLVYRQNLAPIPPPTRQPAPRLGPHRTVTVPDTIDDPLAREIMELVRAYPQTWDMLEAHSGVGFDTVRRWFYRGTFNPGFSVVQSVLAALGYRLKLERIPS